MADLQLQDLVKKYTVLDFETTGLTKPAPVSLGIMVYENNKRVHYDYFECNPEKEIEEGAFRTHHIPQERVDQLPNFSEFWSRVQPYIEGYLIIGHNVKYDLNSVLIPTLQRYGIAVPTIIRLCTCENARKLGLDTELNTKGKHKYDLEACCKYFGIEIENHHHAAYDIYMTQRVFAKEYNMTKGNLDIVTIEGDYNPFNGEKAENLLPF